MKHALAAAAVAALAFAMPQAQARSLVIYFFIRALGVEGLPRRRRRLRGQRA